MDVTTLGYELATYSLAGRLIHCRYPASSGMTWSSQCCTGTSIRDARLQTGGLSWYGPGG